jgi:hypothetical protein
MKSHPYPLPAEALLDYCRPVAGHPFAAPLRHAGAILAANGYLALRATRGGWLDDDYAEASPEAAARLARLPWARLEHLCQQPEWRRLSELGSELAARGALRLWAADGGLAPSPVWAVADAGRIRLSVLQLIARLPRAELWTGGGGVLEPVFFRFSGGAGIVPLEERLSRPGLRPARRIFAPERDALGTIVRAPRPTEAQARAYTGPRTLLPNWPPAEPEE